MECTHPSQQSLRLSLFDEDPPHATHHTPKSLSCTQIHTFQNPHIQIWPVRIDHLQLTFANTIKKRPHKLRSKVDPRRNSRALHTLPSFTHLLSHTQRTALFSFPSSTTIFSPILLAATWYLSRTPVCARTGEPVQTVRKRTFRSVHRFFTNSVHPSERLDKGSIPGTRIQLTAGQAAYVDVRSWLGVAVIGSKV